MVLKTILRLIGKVLKNKTLLFIQKLNQFDLVGYQRINIDDILRINLTEEVEYEEKRIVCR